MDIYRSHWMKESDFDIIKSFGMNTIRLPFDYKLLMDSDTKPFKLKSDAWEWLDLTIKIAKEKVTNTHNKNSAVDKTNHAELRPFHLVL